MSSIHLVFISIVILHICGNDRVWGRIMVLLDSSNEKLRDKFLEGIRKFEENTGKNIDFEPVEYTNESDWQNKICPKLTADGYSMIIDLIYRQDFEEKPKISLSGKGIPYLKTQIPTNVLIKGAVSALEAKQATNGFLIFEREYVVNRGVHLILGNTLIRFAFLDFNLQKQVILEKFDYRVPSAVVIFGSKPTIEQFISETTVEKPGKEKILRNITEWLFMYDEFVNLPDDMLPITFPHIRGYFDKSFCCKLQNPESGEENPPQVENCDPGKCAGNTPADMFMSRLGYLMSQVLANVTEEGQNGPKIIKLTCNGDGELDPEGGDVDFTQRVYEIIDQKSIGFLKRTENTLVQVEKLIFSDDRRNYTRTVNTTTILADGQTAILPVGQYDPSQSQSQSQSTFTITGNYKFRPRPLHFRIGIVNFMPWTYWDNDTKAWAGYCIDLAKGISEKMNFTYDLIESTGFGKREADGRWNGLTGDLVHGKIDIAVAPYIMTSEREEFIDFVSPYYEQSGLLIAMKKPVVKNSLFKFMTVLKPEVWLSIAGATIATGFMLWFLDKFSPYSAQNNPHKYKTFRKFTLKESFWFALTSFTPQGGGEPPKAFSGRTLVAAYWIFVVLMLATFTANLAAFLTVERMQSPIRNLEHLAAQSSVKYSVVNDSTSYNFFKNMAHAEDILYQMWRNLTLTAPSSAKEYIVWEYPIREMYIHIFSVINKTKVVEKKEEGFKQAAEDEYYAFIHDAAQTRYEVNRNCNLTIIGEPFAEAPYAIGVAQGNPLQDNISMAILQLQTARFFETLSARYWTSQCQTLGEGESDGISLESLGGVFIATIIGLGIAFISLAIEVFTTARKRRRAQIEADRMIKPSFVGPLDFYTGTAKGAQAQAAAKKKSELSTIYKRGQFLPEVIN